MLEDIKKYFVSFVKKYPQSWQDDLVQEALIAAWERQQKGDNVGFWYLVKAGKYRIGGVIGDHTQYGGGHLSEPAFSAGGAGDYDVDAT
jgi:hypothetical protein